MVSDERLKVLIVEEDKDYTEIELYEAVCWGESKEMEVERKEGRKRRERVKR